MPFINSARASPALVGSEANRNGKRIVMKGTTNPAIFVMTGLVIQCSLVDPATMGRGDTAFKNKMICLKPLNVEYEHATSFLGHAAGLQPVGQDPHLKYSGPVYEGDITFTTRRAPNTMNGGCKCKAHVCLNLTTLQYAATPASPARSMGKRPARYRQIPIATSVFKYSLSINDTGSVVYISPNQRYSFPPVPIYDATGDSDFLFTDADMERIQSLPLYGDGAIDLPPNSVASVGFSAGTYVRKNDDSGRQAMSFNIQFVILLGQVNRHKMESMISAMQK